MIDEPLRDDDTGAGDNSPLPPADIQNEDQLGGEHVKVRRPRKSGGSKPRETKETSRKKKPTRGK